MVDKNNFNPLNPNMENNNLNKQQYNYDSNQSLINIEEKDNTLNDFIKKLLKFNMMDNKQSFEKVVYSIASSLFYNYIQLNPKFSFSKKGSKYLYLFDKEIKSKKDFDNELFCIIYFSYRNNINPLYDNSSESYISSDCGWGCMIRASQMIFARGLFQLKRAKIKNFNQGFQYNSIRKLREELIYLFIDNSIPIENILSLEDYDYFIKRIEQIARKEPQYKCIQEIIPPFSIQTICKITNNAGNWTSGIKMVNAFIDINKLVYNKVKIIHSSSGFIKELELYKVFCEEVHYTCNCDINALVPESTLCLTCSQKISETDIFNYKGIDYQFKSEGLIFISLRLGLYEIEKEYLKEVQGLFYMRNNIGIIGGKKDRAYYFIGHIDGKFLLLDPHFNQQTIDICNNDFTSYMANDIYLIDPKDMSPEITVGFCIKSAKDLREFIQDIKDKNKINRLYFITIN